MIWEPSPTISTGTLHRLQCHAEFEYHVTWEPRRMGVLAGSAPLGEGWELNTAAGSQGVGEDTWADGTRVRLWYWRRKKARA